MPRQRNKENKGLPERWTFQHGAYYFQVPPGQEAYWGKKKYRLGKTLTEAYAEWAKRLKEREDAHTIGQLLDRYIIEEIPKKAPATRTRSIQLVSWVRKGFGHMVLNDLEPIHIYQYFEARSIKQTHNGKPVGGPTTAKHEIALLSHAYTMAVKWAYVKSHPFKGEVRIEGNKPRSRYVEDWEIEECYSLQNDRKTGSIALIKCAIRFMILTGMDRNDMLRLKESALDIEGFQNNRRKTSDQRGQFYEWTESLTKLIDDIREARGVEKSEYLFCTLRGNGYYNEKTGKFSGWDSMWQRFMKRVLTETKVTERFTEHDLRAKCASDADTLEEARKLLSHSDSRTTNRIYRRKPERIKLSK